nr:hypothetical protein [Tanacetum cinerariifolium]
MTHKNINQLENAVVQKGESITSLQALRTQFELFFKSPNVTCNAYRPLHKDFKESTHYEPVEYRSRLLHYLDELEKLLKERTLKDGKLRLKEKVVKAIKDIEKRLKDKEKHTQERMVMDTILVSQSAALDGSLVTEGTSSAQKNVCSTGNDSSDSQPSSDTNTTSKVHHDTFDNVFTKKVNHGVLQANVLLTNKLENVFVNDKVFVNESEYYKTINLLKEEITNLKSQAYQKEKTFASENKKYDELRKAAQTDQTLCMLLPSEDMVKMGRKGLGFDDHNDVVNPSLLYKAKELVLNLYNAEKIRIDLPYDHKIISEEELKSRIKVSKELAPVVQDVNLQLSNFEKNLVNEMTDDLKYVTSIEDEFDEKCLILDIQKVFFKTQNESAMSVSQDHESENENLAHNSSLETENHCLRLQRSNLF